MSRKILLLAVTAVAALAAMALPALAAAAPEVDFTTEPTEANPVEAEGTTNATATLASVGGSTVTCTSFHTKVKWTSKTTGDLHVLFTGCKSSGFACTGTGLGSGEITVTTGVFHLKYIKGFTKTVGALITPPAGGVWSDFHCTFLVHVVVKGNGIVGHVSSPACGAKSASSTIAFTQSSTGVQTYKEVEGDATNYHLQSEFNEGPLEESSEVATGSTTLKNGVEGTLTCN